MLGFLEIIFHFCVFLFVGFYFVYYLICFIYKNKDDKNNKLNLNLLKYEMPTVSFLIPVYNESKVLKEKFNNLEEIIYPKKKFEIVFIDSGSTDGTPELIENFITFTDLNVKLLQQGSRLGFNNAVIDGFYESSGEIIFIPGAETIYDSNALKIMAKYFSDKNVGAINGKQIIININETISTQHEQSYRDLQEMIKKGENNIDTIFDVKGEIAGCRRFICEKLVRNPVFKNKGCIDACFFFQSRKEGYVTVYEPNAHYYESSPKSLKDSFKQRFRRAATLIQNMLIFKNMIFNPKHGLFGLLILPAHFLMLIILPIIFLTGSFLFLILNIFKFPHYLYLIIFISGISLTFLSKTLQSFIKLQFILAAAIIKLSLGVETQKFERIESTRNNLSTQ